MSPNYFDGSIALTSEIHLKLFLEHRNKLIAYATSLLNSQDSAEDLIQEAWIRFHKLPTTEIQHPSSYLFKIVRNLALDQLRKKRVERLWIDPLTDQTIEIASNKHNPTTTLSFNSTAKKMEQALSSLEPHMRTAFEMHRLGGYTMQQISEHLGISVSSVHRAIHSALQKCLESLKDEL